MKARTSNLVQMLAVVAAVAIQAQTVGFTFDSTRLSSISVDGATILGDDVHTGGAYLIGSADGSDAQGRSITSIGGANGRMKSDNPNLVVPPPYTMKFERLAPNRLGFAIAVGPMPQDFATLSFPFDFGLKTMDKFAFDGDHFTIFSSENDGIVERSNGTYAEIQPKAEIHLLDGTFVGKVGGASTKAPVSWAEVDGPYATVRVSVKTSQRYGEVVFMNHPGTHNMEFGLGSPRKGDTVAISGEITVIPKGGPNSWTFDVAKEFNHQIGRAEADGWSVRVGDDVEHYMCFGPYTTDITAGRRVALFSAMLDNVNADNEKILTFDVADAVSGVVLASADARRGDFARPMEYQDFALPFIAQRGMKLEFRTLWHGVSYARLRGVTVIR